MSNEEVDGKDGWDEECDETAEDRFIKERFEGLREGPRGATADGPARGPAKGPAAVPAKIPLAGRVDGGADEGVGKVLKEGLLWCPGPAEGPLEEGANGRVDNKGVESVGAPVGGARTAPAEDDGDEGNEEETRGGVEEGDDKWGKGRRGGPPGGHRADRLCWWCIDGGPRKGSLADGTPVDELVDGPVEGPLKVGIKEEETGQVGEERLEGEGDVGEEIDGDEVGQDVDE